MGCIVGATIRKIPLMTDRIIVWATQNTFKSGIYQKELTYQFDEKTTISQQSQVDKMISLVKEGDIVGAGEIIIELMKIVEEKEKGSTVILIACTDITVALQSLGAVSEGQGIFRLNKVCFVDSSLCLASEVVKCLK